MKPTPSPTMAPTMQPQTTAPTTPPQTPAPVTQPPTTAPTIDPTTNTTKRVGSGKGDPHFVTWSGHKYDFHGGCDLVMVQNPGFAHGLGMNLHIRTTIKTWWSYISSAVIQIGNDTLEVQGGPLSGEEPLFWINGVKGEKHWHAQGRGGHEDVNLDQDLSGFVIHYHKTSSKQSRFRIALGGGDAINIETFNEMLRVIVKADNLDNFNGSVGLMGSYPDGAMVSRNSTAARAAVMEDPIAFGKEWQVLDSEPMLFHDHGVGVVQHPTECKMPSFDVKHGRKLRRRLGEAMITQEAAEAACRARFLEEDDFDSCVFDVLATNDKETAGAY